MQLYFRLLQGGVDSGFNHVTNIFTPKLYSVKGKRRPVVTQMPKVSWNAMNNGDVFILQMREAIFIWEGETSNKLERLQAAKVKLKRICIASRHCGGVLEN